jgi:hypothetical protein
MFWLYLVTDRAGSWAMLRCRADEEAPPHDETAIVEMVDSFESAPEAVEALVRLEMRLAVQRRRVRPSLRAGPRLLDFTGPC